MVRAVKHHARVAKGPFRSGDVVPADEGIRVVVRHQARVAKGPFSSGDVVPGDEGTRVRGR